MLNKTGGISKPKDQPIQSPINRDQRDKKAIQYLVKMLFITLLLIILAVASVSDGFFDKPLVDTNIQ